MTVAFHSPLPPQPTGVADYASALLIALQRRGNVTNNATNPDVRLYHIGNNHLHASEYDQACREPGVVVLHDAVLQHFLLGRLSHSQYVEEFVFNYGEWHRGTAERLYAQRSRSGSEKEYFDYPMLRRLVTTSRAVVVHNPAAAARVREHGPDTPVYEIPHLWQPEPQSPSPTAPVFGVFGFLRETKRVNAVLRAFAVVHRHWAKASLIIAGTAPAEYERRLERSLTIPGVRRIGHLPELMSKPVKMCINLRYPSAGETSGIAVRMMGAGRCVLLTNSLENSGYPQDACIRVTDGLLEEAELEHYMAWLCANPEAARTIGDSARQHIERHHALDTVADQYWNVLLAHRN